jgi:hypothetical protein
MTWEQYMASKYVFRIFRRALPVFLFFAALHISPAQVSDGGTYFIRGTDREARIVQRISWPGVENVSRYEVVIERAEDDTRFTEAHREFTRDIFADVSLGPGSYRYQVRVYNLLNQFEYATNYASFEIILALQPELHMHSPEAFYLDENPRYEILIEGKNLVKGAAVSLEAAGKTIVPREYIPAASGESARLVFNKEDIVPGSYALHIRNPGGLEDTRQSFLVALGKPLSIYISAGYSPLIPLYGYLFDLFDNSFSPTGAHLRVSLIPIKETWGYLGIEAAPWWNSLSTRRNSADIEARLYGVSVNALYKKWLVFGIVSLNARLGAGIAALDGLSFDFGAVKSDTVFTWMPSLGAGLSFQWQIHSGLFVETGLDYTHLLSKDTPQPAFLNPFAEIGWRF